ncbi:hypothetical protein VTN77DRAFT_5104 [Rasamsonia byssochlamydoides]|uniref:uncharacterized protein n=1 Tax=Rasamsonia byssochlamydoides TaxID=89139 RepID=UPI00374352BE
MDIVWRHSSSTATYEEARVGRVFNHRRPNRYPIAVIRATTESDIINAVKLARQHGCRVAVRSGGHSWAAWSVRDNSILIDLGQYQEIEIDAERRVAQVSPSTTGRMLNSKLIKEYGLMFAGGHCPDVGLGGFLLQGGMGWNCRNWGWACEQVKAVDVVTADGNLVHCNSEQNSDLFWAARGAGPGFPGIVTRFHLQLRPAPKAIRSSGYIFPRTMYREAFDWVIRITPTFDDATEIVAVGQYPPGMDEICLFILFVTMKDTPEEAREALLPAQQTRPAGVIREWFCEEDNLDQEYDAQAAANPLGHRYCADNAYINNDADVPAVLEEAYTTLPSKKSFALWYAMNPCSRRQLPDMALSMQSDHYFAVYTIWEDERDDEKCTGWVRNIMQRVERFSDGAYLGDSDFQVRRTKFWGTTQGKKLMEIRRKWDPEGRICGYLDMGDSSGPNGLRNEHEWSG